jgi:hypothetical protein
VSVLLLGQIKSELVVYGEIVEAGISLWIAMIMVCSVTFFTVIAGESFGVAVALAILGMAARGLIITLARVALATINWISPESWLASITIWTFYVALTLATCRAIFCTARGMTVALAAWTMCEKPLIDAALHDVHWSAVASIQALAQSRFRIIVTPSASCVCVA